MKNTNQSVKFTMPLFSSVYKCSYCTCLLNIWNTKSICSTFENLYYSLFRVHVWVWSLLGLDPFTFLLSCLSLTVLSLQAKPLNACNFCGIKMLTEQVKLVQLSSQKNTLTKPWKSQEKHWFTRKSSTIRGVSLCLSVWLEDIDLHASNRFRRDC